MKKNTPAEYYGGRIKNLVELVARIVADDPKIATDPERLHATLSVNLEGYGKRDKCFNCKRSMKITEYVADLHDGLLLFAMARTVKHNMEKGMDFTEANKVHLPTLEASNATLKRNTKCDYLGLVKQPENWRGTGYWLLTGWAWKALRGDAIPKSAKYWEGKMIGRSEETTTLAAMFKTHLDTVQRAIEKRKAVKADYRAVVNDYQPSEWSSFGGFINDEV